MQTAVSWMKSWKKLVDKGFENDLRREDVLSHVRIDRSFVRKSAPMPVKTKKLVPRVTSEKPSFEEARKNCALIGLKEGTEKYDECVLKLLN